MYSVKDLFLLAVASCAAGAVYHALTARFDEKTRKRALSIGGSALFCMVGLFIMAFPEQLGVRYFGSFLTIMGCQANVPAVIAYQNNNILSHSWRAVAGARTIEARGVGGIIAFTVYRQKDFPKYIPGLGASTVDCQGLIMLRLSSCRSTLRARKRRPAGATSIRRRTLYGSEDRTGCYMLNAPYKPR